MLSQAISGAGSGPLAKLPARLRPTLRSLTKKHDPLQQAIALKFSKSNWVSLAMLFALLAIGMVGNHFSPLLLPKADVTGVVEAGCDLQRQACAASLADGGRLQFSIMPRPIPLLQPLRVEVTVSGIKPKKVEVDFAGESMNMGYNRSELPATGDGRYAGEIALPVCTSGGMAWVATVLVETDRQRIAVPFRFDTGH
jgi:hypothetical protein